MGAKILLPYEVANAINEIKAVNTGERGLFNYPAIANHAKDNPRYRIIDDYINQSDATFKNYFNAIVNGFEADKPPIEKFIEKYDFYVKNNLMVSANAMKETINLLEIRIEGVNA